MWAPDSSYFVILFSVITTTVSHLYRTLSISLGTVHIKLFYVLNLSEAFHQNKSTDLRSERSSKVHLSEQSLHQESFLLQIRERISCLFFKKLTNMGPTNRYYSIKDRKYILNILRKSISKVIFGIIHDYMVYTKQKQKQTNKQTKTQKKFEKECAK